ncbi:hypothetical protein [Dulcicalothrix desertica]|uniref:hypothetical protein n=1 Tax=Dulcicalothrix desertica TaxID=32056 RepID=UPI000F8DF2C7|nr:hypothetical protein [Dulcicalothrix desertica]
MKTTQFRRRRFNRIAGSEVYQVANLLIDPTRRINVSVAGIILFINAEIDLSMKYRRHSLPYGKTSFTFKFPADMNELCVCDNECSCAELSLSAASGAYLLILGKLCY